MEELWKQLGRTVRAAIDNDDRTVRLCLLLTVATGAACLLIPLMTR